VNSFGQQETGSEQQQLKESILEIVKKKKKKSWKLKMNPHKKLTGNTFLF